MQSKLVLVADDDESVLQVLSRFLSPVVRGVELARDGNEAIRKLEAQRFDLALIDIIMPEREGIETIIEIRRRWPDCAVVAMSGGGRLGPDDFLALASKLGADATLRKPFRRADLLAVFEAALERRTERVGR